MKKVVILLCMLLVIGFAVNRDKMKVQTILQNPGEQQIFASTVNNSRPHSNPTPLLPLLGRTEVVGYTTYDWQYNGPMLTRCIVDPVANGIHCSWMFCATQPSAGAPDRNEYYNFYDFATRTWLVPGTGQSVYTLKSGFGSMSSDPTSGSAIIATHQSISSVLNTVVALDVGPGTGLFSYSSGLVDHQWPAVGATSNGWIHTATVSVSSAATGSSDSIYYTRVQTWPNWTTPTYIQPPAPSAGFCTQNIAASRTSNKVVVMWESSDDLYPERAFYTISTDGGATWGTVTQLPFPPSYGGIVPGYHISSLSGMFDNTDNLRIVASVADTGYTMPAQIWMYSPANTGNPWTLIHHYEADTLNAAVGYNAIFATRPTIAQDASTNNFYVCWEQFDSLNYEPLTDLARADIHVAELTNNGQTVSRKGRITDYNTTSKRWPCVAGVKNDTVFVQYVIDSIAGFELYTQGTWTRNPVVLQRFHKNSLPLAGIEENHYNKYYNFSLNALPNPANSHTAIRYSLPATSNIDLTVYDILGRPIRTIANGVKPAGEYSATWNLKDNSDNQVQSGIYFYTLKTSSKSVSRKLIVTN